MAYILIVDDDEDFTDAIATVLKGAGYETIIKSDIVSAEKSIEERRPDLIILDVMFPESSSAGFNLAHKIKQMKDAKADIPILMLTAINAEFPIGLGSKDIDGQWLPVEDFLEKPVEFDILRNKIAEMLG